MQEDIDRLMELVKLGDRKALDELIRIYKRDKIKEGVYLTKLSNLFSEVIPKMREDLYYYERVAENYWNQLFIWKENEEEEEDDDS